MDQKYLCNSAPECPFNSAQLPVFVRVTGNDGCHTKSLLTKCLGVQFVEGRTQIFSLEGARSGVGSVEWVPPFQRGGVWEGRCPFPSFFIFQMEMVHFGAFVLKVKTSQPQPIATAST